jgi:hypothetical protein
MPFPPRPRRSSMLACVLAAAVLMLTLASCSQATPLGPTPPQPARLRSPIVLQAMLSKPAPPGGQCPAGYVTLSAPGDPNPGLCYRKLGTPVTFTSAAVGPAPVTSAAGQPAPPPSALLIAVPAADRAALTAVTTQAYHSRGAVDITVAGKTWAIPQASAPLTHGQFEIALSSSNQAHQLQRILER